MDKWESERLSIEEMIRIKEERGYSLEVLAGYAGLPLGTVRKVLSGASKTPRISTVMALEKVLKGSEEEYPGRAYQFEKASRSFVLRETSIPYGIPQKEPGKYTVDDFYALPNDQRAELINGAFYDMANPTTAHQAVVGLLHEMFAAYIRSGKGQCKVFESPIGVQLDQDEKTMVEPDLVVVCDRTKIRRRCIFGAPDLVMEVLSPSTARKDWLLKAPKYCLAGVRELWMIDPDKHMIIIQNFMEGNGFPEMLPMKGKHGVAIYDGELEIDLDALDLELTEMEAYMDQ